MRKLILLVLFLFLFTGLSFAQTRDTETVLNDIWDNTNDAVRVAPGASLIHGYNTTDAVTAEQLTADATVVKSVIITVLPANKGNVYIGGSNLITSDNCITLTKDSAGVGRVELDVDSAADVYLISQRSGEGVGFVGIVK